MSLRGGRWAVMCCSCSKKSTWQETQRSSFSFQRERERSVHGVTCQCNTFLCTEKLSAIQWHTARIWGRLKTFSDTQGVTSTLQNFWEKTCSYFYKAVSFLLFKASLRWFPVSSSTSWNWNQTEMLLGVAGAASISTDLIGSPWVSESVLSL